MKRAVKVCTAILAAGNSSRMGISKLTMPFAGSSLLEQAISTALKSESAQVVVVTGCHYPETSQIVSRFPQVVELHNSQWHTGDSSSAIKAVEYSDRNNFDAVLLMFADQPFVRAHHLNALIHAFQKKRSYACISRTADRDGGPFLFNNRCFSEFYSLSGDGYIKNLYQGWPRNRVEYVPCRDPLIFFDVDTPEDARHLERLVVNG